MNWKIERDPYMSTVARLWGEGAVWEAGFFADDDPVDAPLDDTWWLCSPTSAVRCGLAKAPADTRPVVLLATGGFWPPHEGHVEMMERARERVRSSGRTVVGGYLSPGHDDYLQLKWGGVAPPAAARLEELRAFTAGQEWLDVDPWESLNRRVSVNYTDVAARLERYLRTHVDHRIDLVFVCGADNSRFALAFASTGGCVVVARPGSEDTEASWRTDPRIAVSSRVLWASGDHPAASSTASAQEQTTTRPALRLRLEDERAVRDLGLAHPSWVRFQDALLERLSVVMDVLGVPIANQPEANESATISLDPLVGGTIDVGVSRLFDLGGAHQLGFVSRPGWPPIAGQLGSIPAGNWTVVDDDRATGDTIRFLLDQLPAEVEIDDVAVRMQDGAGDIADSRDFLLGADSGGLVVELPDGTIGRVPYLLPYVDPSVRSGLPADDVVAFSIDVWKLNAGAFDGTGLAVGDLSPPASAALRLAGHDDSMPLADVCRWHAESLQGRSAFVPNQQAPR